MTDIAFRSAAPEVVEAYQAYEEQYHAVMQRRAEWGRRFAVESLVVGRSSIGNGTEVRGLPGEAEVPDGLADRGWRYSPKVGYLIPSLRRKVGRDLSAEMASLAIPSISLPGMPGFALGTNERGTGLHSPAYLLHSGAVYCRWGVPVGDPVDTEVWSVIPLSEYYLAAEALAASGV